MKPSRPPGTIGWLGAIVLVAASTAAGAASGWLISAFETAFVHVVGLYSLAIGAIVGCSAASVVHRTRVRAPLVAGFVAGLGAAFAWALVAGIHYSQYRPIETALDPAALRDWIRMELHIGTVIEKHGSGVTLGPIGTAIMWILEISFAVGLAWELACKAASAPYCERCQKWYDKSDSIPLGPATSKEQIIDALQREEAGGLTRGIVHTAANEPYLELRLRRCSECSGAPVFAELVEIRPRLFRGREKRLRAGMIDAGLVKSLATAA